MNTIELIIILKGKLSLSNNCHSNVMLLISEAGKMQRKVLMIRIVNDHIILTTIF